MKRRRVGECDGKEEEVVLMLDDLSRNFDYSALRKRERLSGKARGLYWRTAGSPLPPTVGLMFYWTLENAEDDI